MVAARSLATGEPPTGLPGGTRGAARPGRSARTWLNQPPTANTLRLLSESRVVAWSSSVGESARRVAATASLSALPVSCEDVLDGGLRMVAAIDLDRRHDPVGDVLVGRLLERRVVLEPEPLHETAHRRSADAGLVRQPGRGLQTNTSGEPARSARATRRSLGVRSLMCSRIRSEMRGVDRSTGSGTRASFRCIPFRNPV